MSRIVNVVVDAMGGDNSPAEIVKGCVLAVNESPDVKVFLVGDETLVKRELLQYTYSEERIEVVPSTEVIGNDEAPVMAIRHKKDSSIVKGLMLLKEGKADAFVSAGSTGAVLVGGQLIAGRLSGVERTPLAPLIPTMKGCTLIVDCGANVDARPSHLVQFARMGSLYMQHVVGIEKPRVALVNIGTEEEKGNALVKDTYPLLKNCYDLNFIGSIEARQIPYGDADVIVCDAFVGNVILKLYEGLAGALVGKIKTAMKSTLISKLGALLVKRPLKKTLKGFDASDYGGAPMLGLNGLVVKAHGNSKSKEIHNAILQCIKFTEADISNKLSRNLLS